MNITEANLVNRVLRHVVETDPPADVWDAAEALADRAYKPLGAGLSGADIRSRRQELGR